MSAIKMYIFLMCEPKQPQWPDLAVNCHFVTSSYKDFT